MPPITCPYCGSSYTSFQTNCDNCGATLPPPKEIAAEVRAKAPVRALKPPPAPRDVADGYVWRLLLQDGWAVASLIFIFLGAVFSFVGAGLTAGIITAFVGLPFLFIGLPFLFGGGYLGHQRYQQAQQQLHVLQVGADTVGEITELEVNASVQVNGRNPWTVTYRYSVEGVEYEGSLSTLNIPGTELAPGNPITVLYLEDTPEISGLYPRP
jgi:hypothetical protein